MTASERNLMVMLKEVSRSFYLSLRLLPAPMRRAASLAYLMARASDTISDTTEVSREERNLGLSRLEDLVCGISADVPDFSGFRAVLKHRGEAELLRSLPVVWNACLALPESEGGLVREVLKTIISGQKLDLKVFEGGGADRIAALGSPAELDGYTYRVAGCVGEFWTNLGLLTLGERFSAADPDKLRGWGREYGMGLQLVNILRDLPADLRAGRCYLPVADPLDRPGVMRAHQAWVDVALARVSCGFSYADRLVMRRMGVASRLPAEIAMETLMRMRGIRWDELAKRVKVPRRTVYAAMFRSLFRVPRDRH